MCAVFTKKHAVRRMEWDEGEDGGGEGVHMGLQKVERLQTLSCSIKANSP